MSNTTNPVFRAESPRLVIRCWSADDAPAFRALLDRNDRHLRPFIPWMRDEPQTLEQTRARLEGYAQRFHAHDDYRFAWLTTNGTLIGELIISTRRGADCREVGYLLDKDATGKGYAMEATSMATKIAFEVDGVARTEIHCSPENLPSVAIPERLGYTHLETHVQSYMDSEGKLRDSMTWILESGNYMASPASRISVTAFDRNGNALL